MRPTLRLPRQRLHFPAKMAQPKPPTHPMVVVIGSTGTGKSDLAVDLAVRFNGEIINADAMQMYKGLPIITNKISVAEQRGIPHHVLGNISLDEQPWSVQVFKQEASRIIADIRARGKLPIVVGGTHYYTHGLLFEDNLVQGPSTPEPGEDKDEMGSKYPVLDGPTDAMLQRLREVDPVMADRWHPNDRRKIRRSLEIYLTTGRRASEIYAEQQARKESKPAVGPWETLLYWVYTKPDVLNERLNRRVDKMLESGLLHEVSEIYEYLQRTLAQGRIVDQTTGIWQSIGFKQFEPYCQALRSPSDAVDVERLKAAGAEQTKSGTRQYAKYQIRWITRKTLPLLREEQALEKLFLLDSTDVDRFKEEVLEKAAVLTDQYLAGQPLPLPTDLSETAKETLSDKLKATDRAETPCNKTCEVCQTVALTEEVWEKHIHSSKHRRVLRRKKRTAVVPVGDTSPTSPAAVTQDDAEDGDDCLLADSIQPP
jgi:tRNA dimethylallyltransferase